MLIEMVNTIQISDRPENFEDLFIKSLCNVFWNHNFDLKFDDKKEIVYFNSICGERQSITYDCAHDVNNSEGWFVEIKGKEYKLTKREYIHLWIMYYEEQYF